MKNRLVSWTIFYLVCMAPQVWAKTCRVSEEVQKAAVVGNAGCLIRIGDQAVLVDEGKKGISVPGGSTEVGEKSWQTACRETHEEVLHLPEFVTAQVTVQKHLANFRGKFQLFECSLDSKTKKRIQRLSDYVLTDGTVGWHRQIHVMLKSPASIPVPAWRFPKDRDLTVKLFQTLP